MLLLGPDKINLADQIWADVHDRARGKRVIVSSITFQHIIDCFRECLRPHDDEMHDLIDDFENFCSGQNLLGTDKTTLFVPPCSQSFEINVRHKLYFCPSNWSRRNVQYLGIYRNKTVQYIGQISKVVHCAPQRVWPHFAKRQSDLARPLRDYPHCRRNGGRQARERRLGHFDGAPVFSVR